MPSRNYGHGRPNGGTSQGGTTPKKSANAVGQRVQDEVARAGEHVRESYDSAREAAVEGYQRAESMVTRYPTPSILITFGIGFGLGLIATTMLSAPEESWGHWTDRHARDSMGRARRSMRHAQDSIGHLPDAFHGLADALRSLPEAIGRHLPGH